MRVQLNVQLLTKEGFSIGDSLQVVETSMPHRSEDMVQTQDITRQGKLVAFRIPWEVVGSVSTHLLPLEDNVDDSVFPLRLDKQRITPDCPFIL